MAVFRIPDEHLFPNPRLADPSGLLGVGGDLNPQRILLAYQMGIFPWYSQGQPILWWSPDPRMVLTADQVHVPRSLGKSIRKKPFRITLDTAFEQVLAGCASAYRPEQEGTWITKAMQQAYCELHRLGHAHSVEAWEGEQLVGGLYGVALGGLFSGESMFSLRSDSSKVAFIHLIRQLHLWGFQIIDCQVHTHHLARFGAKEIPRIDYLQQLEEAITLPDRKGPWRFDPGFKCTG
jgi:leucyl/phenylalanyl-tRNA---protein transferase